MSKKQLKNYLIPTMLLALMAMPLPAHAGFGTGIGVTFPISGSSSGEIINNTYAALEYDVLTEELNIMEKHGRLVMEFKISNTSDKPYTIQQKTGQVYDFIISDRHGRKLWQWSDGMAFTQALTNTVIPPHDFIVHKVELESKDYRKIKEQAVVVTTWLLNTPCRLTAKVPTHTAANTTPILIHGGVIFGHR